MERFKEVHPGFEGTRELKLIQVCLCTSHFLDMSLEFCCVQDLMQAHTDEDPDKFGDIVCDSYTTCTCT